MTYFPVHKTDTEYEHMLRTLQVTNYLERRALYDRILDDVIEQLTTKQPHLMEVADEIAKDLGEFLRLNMDVPATEQLPFLMGRLLAEYSVLGQIKKGMGVEEVSHEC